MRQNFRRTVAAFACFVFLIGGGAFAEDPASSKESHETHHPEGDVKEKSKDHGMMGSMGMDEMKGMMHDCMNMHKDGKMCDQKMMQKCGEKMDKGECQKMMKKAKDKPKPK